MEMQGKRTISAEQAELLRQIPSVDELLAQPRLMALSKRVDRNLVVEVARAVLADLRGRIAEDLNWSAISLDGASVEELISVQVERILSRSLQPVINATGVILHTNLGRAPLPETVVDEFRRTATQYNNLEYDLEAGARGKRHCCQQLRCGRAGHACGAGSRGRSDRLARGAHRNRRRLSNPRDYGAERRNPSRSRHHESHTPRGL